MWGWGWTFSGVKTNSFILIFSLGTGNYQSLTVPVPRTYQLQQFSHKVTQMTAIPLLFDCWWNSGPCNVIPMSTCSKMLAWKATASIQILALPLEKMWFFQALPEDQIISGNQGNPLLRSTFCAPSSNGIFISKRFTMRNLDKYTHHDFSALLPLIFISLVSNIMHLIIIKL